MEGKLHSSMHHDVLRTIHQSNTMFTAYNLMYPIFVTWDDDAIEHITNMPGQERRGINKLRKFLEPMVEKGLKSVLLFGVVEAGMKDYDASYADCPDNPIIRAIPLLREWFPKLLIACDVCLCPYMCHGHCMILDEFNGVKNAGTIKRLSEVAVAYAKAGAHVVAPSDMMDNRVKAIKNALLKSDMAHRVSVLSYSAKFASNLYGPFRDAAKSVPSFGDRCCYQLPIGSKGLALQAIQRDVVEGADMLMVKPAMPYLDIVHAAKDMCPNHPLFVYQVSGEYTMLYFAASHGSFNLEEAVLETVKGFRRAGADCIITYFTPLLLDILARSAIEC